MQLINKNIKRIWKIVKFWYDTIYVVCWLYKKIWTQTPIHMSLGLQILSDPSKFYESSPEMLPFVSIIHHKLCETFSIFYHNLHIWYHDILTNLVIFRLRLVFVEFKNHSDTRSWSCFLNKMFEISFHFLHETSIWTQRHEYDFPLILFYYFNHLQFKFHLNQ